MNLRGELKSFNKDEIKFIYRGSNLAKDLIILSVVLQGESGNKDQIKNKKISLINKKKKANLVKSKLAVAHSKIQKIKKHGNLLSHQTVLIWL